MTDQEIIDVITKYRYDFLPNSMFYLEHPEDSIINEYIKLKKELIEKHKPIIENSEEYEIDFNKLHNEYFLKWYKNEINKASN